MTVRDPKVKADRELKFEIFRGCFGSTGIAPSDVDFFVECRGRFLFIEGKGARLNLENGQRRALMNLSRLPGVTVLIIGGEDPNAPTVMQRYPDGKARTCTLDDVRAFIGAWYADAMGGPT